jgi:cytoskeleton protein RodZ
VADKKSKIASQAPDSAAESVEPSLGQMMTAARERKGLTREQVVTDAHLPAHYVKMIESDSYGMISDQLYLVPFLRRYATFLGLDAEEVASRFVRDVQRAESNVVRISQEIRMVVKRKGVGGRIAVGMLIAALAVLLGDFAWRRYVEYESPVPAPVASPATAISPPSPAALTSPAAVISPAAQASQSAKPASAASPEAMSDDALPPVTIVTNPDSSTTRGSRPAQRNGASTTAGRPAPSRPSAPPADE